MFHFIATVQPLKATHFGFASIPLARNRPISQQNQKGLFANFDSLSIRFQQTVIELQSVQIQK
jgi:hypothetical protein